MGVGVSAIGFAEPEREYRIKDCLGIERIGAWAAHGGRYEIINYHLATTDRMRCSRAPLPERR